MGSGIQVIAKSRYSRPTDMERAAWEAMKKRKRAVLAKKGYLLKDYYTKRELAGALGFSITAINRWHSSGTGPPSILLGGIRLYPKTGVEEWIKRAAGASKPAPKRK
jgi:predicted DNA-binding transcriptional regulator AlpA